MIAVEFKGLTFKNVRCHSEGFLDFPTDNLTALVGPNGAGKSTHLMALCAVLFGKTAEGIEMPDLVNRKAGKNLEIELSLTIDNIPYEIKRYYKHSKYSNKLFLFRDGVDISAKTTPDTYKMIESLLVPRDVFLNTIYFSQQVKDFFTALTDKQQKDIFKSIFQTHEFVDYGANALKEERKYESHICDLDNEINKLVTIRDGKMLLVTNLNNKQRDRSELLTSRIESLNTDNSIKSKEIEEHTAVLTKLSKEYDISFEELIQKLRDRYTELTSEIASISSKFDSTLEKLTEKKNQITDSVDDQLKAILDNFVSKGREDLQKEISGIYEEANKIRAEKQTALKESSDTELKLRNDLETNSDGIRTELSSLSSEFETLHKEDTEIKQLNNQLASERLGVDHETTVALNELKTIKTEGERLNVELAEQDMLLKSFDNDPEICPTCGSKIEDSSHIDKEKAKITTKMSSINEQLEKLRSDFAKKTKAYKKIKSDTEKSIGEKEKQVSERLTSYLSKKSVLDNKSADLNKKLIELKTACDEKISLELRRRHSLTVEFDAKIGNTESTVTVAEDFFSDKCCEFEETTKRDLTAKVAEQINQIDSKYEEVSKTKESQVHDLKVESQKINLQIETTKVDAEAFRVSEYKILELQQLVDSNQKMITELESQFANDPLIEQSEKEIEELIEQISTQNEERNKVQRSCDIARFWKEGFSDRGIPSMLIDGSLPFMNETVRNEAEKLAPNKYLIRFDTVSETKAGDMREKFSISIQNLETGADKHSILSGGERRQVDVCCMTMLRKLMENLYQKTFNITLFDEALDSLDADNAAMFCRAMKQLAENQSVVLITHSITQNAECDRVFHF